MHAGTDGAPTTACAEESAHLRIRLATRAEQLAGSLIIHTHDGVLARRGHVPAVAVP